ncbi:DegQ family serine endoprotease [Ectothiorhodospiraceae bacterium BW-2]|nr:DegQ family serine endoprotease [Ectothiorhodospiraceae bacterium BW-2]
MKRQHYFSFLLSCGVMLLLVALPLSALPAVGLPNFTELVEQNSPAVVNISTHQRVKRSGVELFQIPNEYKGTPWDDLLKRFFGDNFNFHPQPDGHGDGFESQSLGSGFIIDEQGFVLTNNHVVENADTILVRLSDRRELEAEVIGTDPQTDLALLKINADNLPVVKFGDSTDLKVGEWVMAIGSPFGFDHSVSVGVVSALGRSLPSENYVPFIQTDVAINPGNSGGPLFNLSGEVVGINSQIYSRTGGFMGLSFAIPVDVAQNVVKQLKENGSVARGWLGVLIQDVTRELAESFGMDRPQGALVAQILDGSPAAEAGLEVGDIILAYNGTELQRSSDLPPLVGKTRIGKRAELKLLRNGKEMALKVEIGELPQQGANASRSRVAPKPPAPKGEVARVGLVVAEVSPQQRKQLNIESGGVIVEKAEGVALSAGLRQGDVITQFNNRQVKGVESFMELVGDVAAGRSVPVLVVRQSGPRFLALKVAE